MSNEERADKIKAIMKEQKMSAVGLHETTGIHRNTIANALRGKGITVKTLIGIADGLGVSPSILI